MKPSTVSELARTILAQRYDNPQPTPEFHEELWELCCSDHSRVAIGAPRGHAKTTAITGSYTIAKILFREAKYIYILSDTESQAAEFLAEIKLEFQENQDLIDGFGFKKFVKDSETDCILEFSDGHRARIRAKGAEQKVRGRKWRGTRPDMFIIDDLENEELTESDHRREKLKGWFTGSVLPAGSDNCIFRYVGTVMHFDSLLENLMPNDLDENTVIESLRTYNLHASWLSVKYRAHSPDFKDLLWPEKFSEKKLRAIQAEYTQLGTPEVYMQEYHNIPLSDDNAYFDRRDFRSYSSDLRQAFKDKSDGWPTYIAGDLAISKSKKAAFTVFTVGKMGPNGCLHIVDVVRGRFDSLEIINELFALVSLWTPEEVFLEAENIQRTMSPIIHREMRDRGEYFTFSSETPVVDKTSRARPLQARMKAGMVLIDEEAEWFGEWQQELRRFPKSPFKDQVDSSALLAAKVNDMSDPLTAQEQDDEDYHEEYGDFSIGRNPLTGY